jgi:hypothetical protein
VSVAEDWGGSIEIIFKPCPECKDWEHAHRHMVMDEHLRYQLCSGNADIDSPKREGPHCLCGFGESCAVCVPGGQYCASCGTYQAPVKGCCDV